MNDQTQADAGSLAVSLVGPEISAIAAADAFGGVILALEFEQAGDPLGAGGFDGLIGGAGARDAAAPATVSGGKLRIVTSSGDLSQAGPLDAKNHFAREVDLSDPALTELFLTTRFENPFTEVFLASRGLGALQNFAQQGIVLAVADEAQAQNPGQSVKLVLGGFGGDAVQLWSQGAVNQTVQIAAIAAAAAQPFGLFDIAAVELTLAADKSAGTVAQIVTFYDATGAVLGGLRPTATPGFLTAAPQTMPPAVLAALTGKTVDVGVTATDFGAPALDGFTATWDALQVASPQHLAPVGSAGPGPLQDLDGDGIANAADLDLDGDGALNGAETFSYDSTNLGRALAPGQAVRLDFDTAGTPFQNGFTGALLSPNNPDVPEINLANASVANGVLTVTATTGDNNQAINRQENALVAGFRAAEGLSVETRFAIPDYDPLTPGRQAALGYQNSGVVIGTTQDSLVKAVFGRAGGTLQLIQDNADGGGNSQILMTALPVPLGSVAEVSIRLEVFLDGALAKARAFATFYDASGAAIPNATNFAVVQILGGAPVTAITLENALPTQVLTGGVLGAGVIQNSAGAAGRPTFEVDYQYVEVRGLADDAVATEPGVGPGQDLDRDGILNFADADIDGDAAPNATDVFYFDAQNGRPLADGALVRLDFATPGTAFENGFTGVMQGVTADPTYQKETGAGAVAGGQLVVAATGGDTGGANNPQDNYHFGIKRGGGFTVETVIDNPFGAEAKQSYKQLGLAISLDSANFLKFVAGNVGGDFEFSYNNADIETKVRGNLPADLALFGADEGAPVAKLQLVIDVDIDAAGQATATATATVLDASGAPITWVAPITLATLDLAGDLEAALADPGRAVGVGVTQTSGAGGSFDAKYDYIEVRAQAAEGSPTDIALSSASVSERAPGAVIGALTTSEPDGDPVTLQVNDARFEIVGNLLKLKAGVALDYEATPGVAVKITATDVQGSYSETFAIAVGNDPSDDAPTEGGEIILVEGRVTTTDAYGPGTTGAAVLRVMAGVGNVQGSNYGEGSFQLENTGGKKIAAVFIDVGGALYPDMVFDADGSGGDEVFKDFTFGPGSDASALATSGYEHFFLPARTGPDPLFFADKQNSGAGADGGWRGLLLKFDGAGNGFATGETVNFAGDMDPNSIAGLLKTTVESSGDPDWHLGGVSGAELIGSTVTIMFSDGTFATGQLLGDGSQAGAQALISQAVDAEADAAGLTVNGVAAGGSGTYGGATPTVVVTGEAGATVRVILTKGFDPMGNAAPISNTTADQLVADRLEAYAFQANNAAEFQTRDVVIPASGSIDVGGLFAYSNAPNGNSAVPNFDKLQLGFVAAVIDPVTKLAIGAVTAPIYLANNGAAVSAAAASATSDFADAPFIFETRTAAADTDDPTPATVAATEDGPAAPTGSEAEAPWLATAFVDDFGL